MRNLDLSKEVFGALAVYTDKFPVFSFVGGYIDSGLPLQSN